MLEPDAPRADHPVVQRGRAARGEHQRELGGEGHHRRQGTLQKRLRTLDGLGFLWRAHMAAEPVLVVDLDANAHDYGVPGDVVRMRKTFDGFAALPHAVGDYTLGPEAELHGHAWRLVIYPGGYNEENKDYLGCT